MERIQGLDLGGIQFSFGRNQREGTRFVDIGIIGRTGQLIT